MSGCGPYHFMSGRGSYHFMSGRGSQHFNGRALKHVWGVLNLCNSAEVGVALKISAVLIMSALEDEGVARAICSAVGAARKISAEGVADLMYSVAEC